MVCHETKRATCRRTKPRALSRPISVRDLGTLTTNRCTRVAAPKTIRTRPNIRGKLTASPKLTRLVGQQGSSPRRSKLERTGQERRTPSARHRAHEQRAFRTYRVPELKCQLCLRRRAPGWSSCRPAVGQVPTLPRPTGRPGKLRRGDLLRPTPLYRLQSPRLRRSLGYPFPIDHRGPLATAAPRPERRSCGAAGRRGGKTTTAGAEARARQ